MNFELPPPGPEALYHPPFMTWAGSSFPSSRLYAGICSFPFRPQDLTRLPNIRPFLGWTTYPFVSYDDWVRKYTSEYCPVYDRQPGRPEFELHGVINDGAHQGGYVSVDEHTLIMAPTRLRPGQYHHHAEDREWNYYETPSEAPHPRKSYGFYRSVVDFGIEAKGQVWDLFLAMREPMMQGDTRPGILIIARKDYAFSVPPGYRPRDMQWTAGCESSSLVKVGDYRIPDNGCLEFRDKIARGIRESAGHFEVLSGAGDGIYPVEIIKDAEGLVACVKVRFDGQGDVNLDNPGPIASCNSRLIGLRNPHSLDSGVIGEPGARKNRRKSTSDMLDITKGFLKDVGNAARRVL